MTGRSLTAVLLAITAAATLCVGGLIGFTGAASACSPHLDPSASPSAGPSAGPSGSAGPVAGYDSEQLANATIIVSVGADRGIPIRAMTIAVATAIQESSLRNLGHLGEGNDHDSLGLFQQRPSQGWGTPQQIMDPVYASGRFYDKLLTIPGWETMPLTQAAQAVQLSAHPDRYAIHEADATALVAYALSPGAGLCIGGEWTQPVHAFIVSGFGPRGDAFHYGVDLAAGRGTPIVAASSGQVVRVRCNAIDRRDFSDWGCDRDGNPQLTLGCGWYLDLLHAGNVITRYCHMDAEPEVREGDMVITGQRLGVVGSTGHSSGPHLHFEVHMDGDRSSRGAVDPASFMAQAGAPLGQ